MTADAEALEMIRELAAEVGHVYLSASAGGWTCIARSDPFHAKTLKEAVTLARDDHRAKSAQPPAE